MQLELIYDSDLSKFCEWLINKIQLYFISEIDDKKCAKFNEFINQNMRWKFQPRLISTKDILKGCIYNLRYYQTGNKFIIDINPNIYIPDSYNKYISIARLINYGNLSVSPYPIFTETFKYFDDNAHIYFQEYLEE